MLEVTCPCCEARLTVDPASGEEFLGSNDAHQVTLFRAEKIAAPRYMATTRARLRECCEAGRPFMLLGGMTQLHELAQDGRRDLPTGSLA